MQWMRRVAPQTPLSHHFGRVSVCFLDQRRLGTLFDDGSDGGGGGKERKIGLHRNVSGGWSVQISLTHLPTIATLSAFDSQQPPR